MVMHKRYTKNPVGAHYGVRDWLLQRLTAVVMAGYTIFVIFAMLLHRPLNYPAWKSVFSEMWFQVGTMLFVASLLYHAWVGMRDILMDYIKPTGIRLTLQFGVAFVLLFYLVWTAAILWGR
jgi:succinate dehydrogenase / fumarate reductase membrane anchor subunit